MTRQFSAIEQRIEWTRFRRASDKAVLKALARWYAWRADGSNVRPSSLADLSEKSEVAERSLDRVLRRLVEDGWLEVITRRHNDTATYRICVERLATMDPDQLAIVVVHDQGSARHNGALEEVQRATLARSNESARHNGALNESGALENANDFEKVARSTSRTRDLYVQRSGTTGYTHTHNGADAPTDSVAAETTPARPVFRHKGHAYCGASFCVPEFLDEEFQQLSMLSKAELEAWYRTLNAECIREHTKIRNALKWLRARFAELVGTLTAPQQLSFGPMVPAPAAKPQESARDNVWAAILSRVQDKVNRHNFDTWFQRTRLIGVNAQTATVRVPSDHIKDWLTSHYAVILQEAVTEIGRPDLRLAFVTAAIDREQTG